MSASFQTLPNPGPPGQPGMIYPTTTTTTTPSTSNINNDQITSSDHSTSGSFGMVFIVLAIILVISVIACIVGRLCGKKSSKSHNQNHPKAYKNNDHVTNDQDQHRNPNPNLGGYNPSQMMNHHQANPHKGGYNNPHKPHGGMPSGGRPKIPDLEFGYRSKEGDIKLGFDPKSRMIPTSKVAHHNSGDFRVDSMGRGGMEPHQKNES